MTAPTTTAAAGDTPGRPARLADSALPGLGVCGHWMGDESRYCRETEGVRLFIPGHRCPAHTPAALQGKPESPTGPGWPIHRTEAQA